MPVVRVIDASIDETIEIRWVRRVGGVFGDQPPEMRTQELRTRHTAPPPVVWDATLKETTRDDRTDRPSTPD